MGKPRRNLHSGIQSPGGVGTDRRQEEPEQASREYGIKDSVISRWKQEFMERAPQVFEQPGRQDAQVERIAELERMVGRLTMQLEMAKKVFGDSDFLSKDGG